MASASLTVQELAEMTGVSRSSVYVELEETGRILGVTALKIRNRWVIPRRPIEQALHIGEQS